MVRLLFALLFCSRVYLKVEFKVKNVTETLGIGSRAPEFSLAAANRDGDFSLSSLRAQGPVILEFLRGTW
jgi:hypothetical protein